MMRGGFLTWVFLGWIHLCLVDLGPVNLGLINQASAQYLPDGNAPVIVLEDNEAARQAISQSLQTPRRTTDSEDSSIAPLGNTPTNPRVPSAQRTDAQATGDPVLDDVLEIIRRRGSILDGSSLDPATERTADDEPQSVIIGLPGGPRSPTSGPGDAAKGTSVYHVAENLLRTARLLEALPDQDESQLVLIRDMRNQATRLLIQSLSRDPHAAPPAVNQSR